MFQALNASVANQASDSAQFQNFASAQQLNLYKVALANGSLADRVSASESTVIKYQPAHKVAERNRYSVRGVVRQRHRDSRKDQVGRGNAGF